MIVLCFVLFMPLASSETWTRPYTIHEHAVDMLVNLYDKQGMYAYN